MFLKGKNFLKYISLYVFTVIVNNSYACHGSAITSSASVNNGNGTTTFTLTMVIDVGGSDGYSLGFGLIFNGSPCATPTVMAGYTPVVTRPGYNNLVGYTGSSIGTAGGSPYFFTRYGNRNDVLTYESSGGLLGFGSTDYFPTIIVTVAGCVNSITLDGDIRTVSVAAANSQCVKTYSTGTVCPAAAPLIVNSPTVCSGTAVTLTVSGATTYTWSNGIASSSITASPTITTNYTVTGTSFGCTSTKTTVVTVIANPTVTVNNPTICAGASAVLTPTGATTYSWSSGASTSTLSISPTSTTVYTVTGTTTGCSSINTTTATVASTPIIASTSSTICSGGTATLTASGGTSYTWTPGSSTNTTLVVSLASSATYTVIGSSALGCTNTAIQTISVNPIPTTTASATGTISCFTPSITLNSTLAGVTYTWTAPIGGSVSSANTQSASASGASGIYTLTIQNAAGCSYSTTTSVLQNTLAPTGLSAGANQTLTCVSSTLALNGSITTPTNASVLWTGPSLSGTATNYTTSANGAGVYTLTATDPNNGCAAT